MFSNMTHLLLPLLASLLFVGGMIFTKRASIAGVGPLTFMFVTNITAAGLFSFLWLLGGEEVSIKLWWQPVSIASLYMVGLSFTFLAIQKGDVSIAAPVFGIKVVLVAFLLTAVDAVPLEGSIWVAACLATLGIGLIKWTGQGERHHVWMTVIYACISSGAFAAFDVLVQRWAPQWGAGRLLPVIYWTIGVVSLLLLPWVQWSELKRVEIQKLVLPAALLVSLQAICIVVAVGMFGDAARVNVVYSLRGLWGVGLAWLAARIWGGREAHLTWSTLFTRFLGAAVLTAAVVVVILAGG